VVLTKVIRPASRVLEARKHRLEYISADVFIYAHSDSENVNVVQELMRPYCAREKVLHDF
jgi:hypothetical protein